MTVGTDVYVSVADADNYCEAMGLTSWDAAEDSEKEIALRRATQYLDANFRWAGRLEDSDQLLGWPRSYAYDSEGRLLEDIPTSVANACAELAVLALSGDLSPMTIASASGAVKREKVGQVEVEYTQPPARHVYDKVVMMLRGIGSFSSNGGAVKVIRA